MDNIEQNESSKSSYFSGKNMNLFFDLVFNNDAKVTLELSVTPNLDSNVLEVDKKIKKDIPNTIALFNLFLFILFISGQRWTKRCVI